MKGLKVRTGIRAPAPIDVAQQAGLSAWLKPWDQCPCGSQEHQRGGHDNPNRRDRHVTVPPGCTSGYAERAADKLTLELLRAYNLADGREARVFDATQVARTWVRRLLQDAEQIAAAEGTQGAARLRAMGEVT